MSETFLDAASNPQQYDLGEVDWRSDGNRQHFTRRMLLEAILPHVRDVKDKEVLDIGAGHGWLCQELTERGARTLGIEPSLQNVNAAREQFPALDFKHTSFGDFYHNRRYDLITATMVFEHMRSLPETFRKVRTLIRPAGRLAIVSGDFGRFTAPRFGYAVDLEQIREGEVAARTDYGEPAGVIYDIIRTPHRFMVDAADAGLKTVAQQPYSIPDWVLQEQPRYEQFEGKPVFQVLVFEPA